MGSRTERRADLQAMGYAALDLLARNCSPNAPFAACKTPGCGVRLAHMFLICSILLHGLSRRGCDRWCPVYCARMARAGLSAPRNACAKALSASLPAPLPVGSKGVLAHAASRASCQCEMRWSAEGALVATTLFDAARFHYSMMPVCRCGHSARFEACGLWWHFKRARRNAQSAIGRDYGIDPGDGLAVNAKTPLPPATKTKIAGGRKRNATLLSDLPPDV